MEFLKELTSLEFLSMKHVDFINFQYLKEMKNLWHLNVRVMMDNAPDLTPLKNMPNLTDFPFRRYVKLDKDTGEYRESWETEGIDQLAKYNLIYKCPADALSKPLAKLCQEYNKYLD